MIISASYKTDIPTFYAEWFRKRLAAGFCRTVNPYNRNQHYKVSLNPEDVDGFVFWTKNIGPFLGVLDLVRDRDQPFVIQHTINGYPRELESRVIDAERSIAYLREFASRFGPKSAVWRYDTIVFSTLTSPDFHRRNFEQLARELEGATDEVVVSFMRRTRRLTDIWTRRPRYTTWRGGGPDPGGGEQCRRWRSAAWARDKCATALQIEMWWGVG